MKLITMFAVPVPLVGVDQMRIVDAGSQNFLLGITVLTRTAIAGIGDYKLSIS